ncbi:MAG TPA: polysaccharide biosynthesis/export family protein [Candidatus Koribacter sp.]|jgi:polysaccharide export outer membrane protein
MKLAIAILLLCTVHAAFGQSERSAARLTIGPGDLLSVEVFDVPELKQEVRVSDTGETTLALVGKLSLAGRTVEEAEHEIATQLETRKFVVHPQVAVLVREYATQGLYINGEVRKPGVYAVLGPHTLLQLIAEAGGLTEAASPQITVRHADKAEENIRLRPGDASSGDVVLRPGDTVVVPRAGIAYIVGDVARSGGYVMQDAGELTIAQLVALGGGLLPTAKAGNAKLVRKTAQGRQEVEVNVKDILRGRAPDLALHADDILFIPNSAWRSAANRLQNITHVMNGARIGAHCNVGDHTFVETGVVLGDNVTVKNGVAVWDGVTAENNVFIGPNVVFTNDRNPRAAIRKTKDQFLPTLLREGATLGANVTAVCGITVGRYAFAAAGAVLTHDVPDYALVMGNPARVAGYVCECGNKLNDQLLCACGLKYARQNGFIVRVPF